MRQHLVFTFILFFSLVCTDSYGYSFSRGRYGEFPKWATSVRNLTMYYRADNDSSIASSDIYSILQSSVSEWNSHGDISVGLYPSSVNNQYDGRNDIYFSDSSTFFSGGGVVGVTQLVYRSGTGEILEADIILNDNYSFSTNTSDRYYLGNVVTHELGHVLGLGHSEVHNSTMFYQLSKNQHNVIQDDKSAVAVLYPTAVSLGSISGKVVGGERLLGVFAA
ncbi:MAG: matrixin family metalloprotease, partial [Bacteriovoracaceae bacterium]|nr:matrixin family metalloprotease [Bacteriovoracaceae bacterium]